MISNDNDLIAERTDSYPDLARSAMLPQGGTDTRVWREVVELGVELAGLAGLRGSRVEADLAMIWD